MSNKSSYVRKNGKLVKAGGGFAAVNSVLASFICIIIGLIVGLVILLCIDAQHAWDAGFVKILLGGFNNIANSRRNMGNEIAQTAPLILTGLSVAFAFKTGLFNIGAAGQYTVGAFGAIFFAIQLRMPWYVALLAAMVCGAIWGAIPGLLKAYFNVNEVITSIMFNWIALYGVNEILKTSEVMYDITKNKTYNLETKLSDGTQPFIGGKIPDLGLSKIFTSSTTIAIFIAIIIAIIVSIILNKTTFGYELKACGHNKDAAKYAGINEKRNIVLSMVIAGALSGIGAGLYYLSNALQWDPNVSTALPAMGFNGIPAALLALSNPIGVIFSALFISHITVGGGTMSTSYFQPEIADIIVGVIIYLCAFVMLFKSFILKVIKPKETTNANAEVQVNNNKIAKDTEIVKGDAE